jgi:hypothetical protein
MDSKTPAIRGHSVRGSSRERYRATRDAEGRLLLLIDAFSRKRNGQVRYLEGRVKLAKLDFLLRYPRHLARVLAARGVSAEEISKIDIEEAPLDARMMRYRYGPWDPAYYAVLGSLIGRGLVEVAPLNGKTGFGYRTTDIGSRVAHGLQQDESFASILGRLRLITRHLDKSGNTLKDYVYELPEVMDATWGEEVV